MADTSLPKWKRLNTNNSNKPHAIFIPYPLQGHVIPSVNLATSLASHGFRITFVNTHFIHQQISKARHIHPNNTGPDIFSAARDLGLDIGYTTVSDGLPVGFDRSLHHDQFMAALLHVFSAHAEELVAQIVGSGEEVHCLIADTFFVWPSKVAKKFGLLYVSFWTEPALVFSLYYHMDLLRLNCHFGCQDVREDTIDYIPGVKAIEPKDMTSYLQQTDATTVCHQIIYNAFNDSKNADFVLCNTVPELEPETLSPLQAKMPFHAIGPIFPNVFTKSLVATSLWSESNCTQWLDKKPDGSVLYVSFGSYAHCTARDLEEMSNGLLLSEVNFLWVMRPDIVSSYVDPLPKGLKENIADRGMIIPWCDQKSVLAHLSIGGFLTHCGWNSILESIWCGVPMLCFPLYTDQFTNRKLVVDDWKVGINLSDRNLITKEDVSRNVQRLMGGDQEFKNRMKKMKETLEKAVSPGESSEGNMGQFIKDIINKIQKMDKSAEVSLQGFNQ